METKKVEAFSGIMKLVADAKKAGRSFKDHCEGTLIEKGYVKNDVFGWEKIEILEKFNLDPDMKVIPSKRVDEVNHKDSKKAVKDNFGKNTGEYKIERLPVSTGKTLLVASDNWNDYINYKRQLFKQELAKEQNMENLIESYV